ncbi:MAG: hypothetical protein FRX49_03825 [Trebouxia sp. A1-2]|nr:MAG: hypothetical protein FRX49_03825 [Trebouxia sp. A1-2]
MHLKHKILTQQCQASLAKGSSCSQLMSNFSSLIVHATVQRITDNAPSLELSATSTIAVQANSHKLYILTFQTARACCQDCSCQLRVVSVNGTNNACGSSARAKVLSTRALLHEGIGPLRPLLRKQLLGPWHGSKPGTQEDSITYQSPAYLPSRCTRQLSCLKNAAKIAPTASPSQTGLSRTAVMAMYLFGDVVDGVKAKAGGGFHQGMRAHHHVHQASTCTISMCLRKDLGFVFMELHLLGAVYNRMPSRFIFATDRCPSARFDFTAGMQDRSILAWDTRAWLAIDDNIGDPLSKAGLSPGVSGHGFGSHNGSRRHNCSFGGVGAQPHLLGKHKVLHTYPVGQNSVPLALQDVTSERSLVAKSRRRLRSMVLATAGQGQHGLLEEHSGRQGGKLVSQSNWQQAELDEHILQTGVRQTCRTLWDAGVLFMAPLTMMRVDKISCSSRGTMPGRAS